MAGDPLFDLSGRVALVSGASRGIGEATAQLLASRGAHVWVSSRKISDCELVAAAIRDTGGQATACACHIGDPGQIEAIFSAIRHAHGHLDILVNNAATNPYFGSVVDTDLGAFQKTVDVNIRGYFLMSQHGARLMLPQGRGSIVNVASVAAVTPSEYRGIYSITKAAVMSMTKSFAKELAIKGVRVNALLPGAIDTRFAAVTLADETLRAKALEHVPMKRVGTPQEMAAAILYLASDASTYTTGTCLNADGGYLLV